MDTSTPQAAPVPEKRSLFTTIVTSTPVLLAVIATFILGQSSSEMTKAQYQRAVAGQNQSKVTNQWDFFQAKRIRGTSYETTAVLLYSQGAEPFSAEMLLETSKALVDEIQLAQKDTPKASDQLKALQKKAESSLERIMATLNPPAADAKDGRTGLTAESVKTALAALESYPRYKKDKSDGDDTIDAEQLKLLAEILADIRAFKPEKEVAPKTLSLKTDTIDKAMEKAKATAAKVSERGKAIDRVLEEFDALVEGQAALGREYQRLMAAHLTPAKTEGNGPDAEKSLDKRLKRVHDASAKLLGWYKAARLTFDARRYEDDARSNQDAAYLYDVYVLQSSARSDKHLGRSFGFMIAMLVAQVGVTIGTLALAMKWRLPTWMIAVLAGLSALALGVYVFLELGPLKF